MSAILGDPGRDTSPRDSGPGPGGRLKGNPLRGRYAAFVYEPGPYSVRPMLVVETLGAQLRELRAMRGLSQKDLADRVGISAPQISQIETGRYCPSLQVLLTIVSELEAHLEIELNEGGLFPDVSGGPERPPAPETR